MRLFASVLPLLVAAASLSAQSFDASKLAARRDSFEVVIGGSPRATLTYDVSRTTDTVRIVQTMVVNGGMYTEKHEIMLDPATLAARSHAMSRGSAAASSQSNYSVSGGRARGVLQRPGRGGVMTTTIDLEATAGATDDDALGVLVATRPLAEGFSTKFRTIYLSGGTFLDTDVRVAGKQSITVPAGTFEVYKVVVESNVATAYAYVTTSLPRRMVQLENANGSTQLRLVK